MWAKLFATIAFVMLLPGAALATGVWTDCSLAGTTASPGVRYNSKLCWVFTTTEDSPGFTVSVRVAEVCLDPNIATEGTAAAEINIRKCHRGYKPAANPENECILMNSAPLDGTQGSPASQNACLDVERGTYFIENSTGAGGVTAVVSITPE